MRNVAIIHVSFCLFKESYTYKDPITEFVECLYVNFDFDGAQKKLRECESVSSKYIFISLFTRSFSETFTLVGKAK